jgi:hypothetical protein
MRRLDASNPETGTTRVGREAEVLALRATETDVRADVWQPSAQRSGDPVAVTHGIQVLPARVRSCSRLEIEWMPARVPAAGAGRYRFEVANGCPPIVVGAVIANGLPVIADPATARPLVEADVPPALADLFAVRAGHANQLDRTRHFVPPARGPWLGELPLVDGMPSHSSFCWPALNRRAAAGHSPR